MDFRALLSSCTLSVIFPPHVFRMQSQGNICQQPEVHGVFDRVVRVLSQLGEGYFKKCQTKKLALETLSADRIIYPHLVLYAILFDRQGCAGGVIVPFSTRNLKKCLSHMRCFLCQRLMRKTRKS